MYSVTQIYKKAGHTLWVLACGIILFAGHADLAAAQTKSARGINTSSSSIGAMAPELGNLESEVLETVTLMEDIENCAQNSRFFDTNTGGCRTTDPANVEFEQDADSTTVEVQNPDGTSVEYSLDGADGVATNGEGEPLDPEDPDEPEVGGGERERYICRRSGITWEQGSDAMIRERMGNAMYKCCEGFPEATAGPVAGYIARQWPGIRQQCP